MLPCRIDESFRGVTVACHQAIADAIRAMLGAMATLINQIQIINLAPATPTAFPHGLNIDGVGLVPDRVEADNGNLRINSANATNVIVENIGAVAASGTVQAEHMHSIERAIPPALADLPVLPFLPQSGGGGGGGGTAEFLGTTGADVDVGSAAPPAAGQVLKATDATHATWQAESGGSADALGTTGADVNVGAAAPPAAGQALIATDATHATWQAVGVTNPLILKTGNGTVTAPAAYASGAIGHGIDGDVGTADVQIDPLGSGLAIGWVNSFAGGTARVKASGKASFARGIVSLGGVSTGVIEAGGDGACAFGYLSTVTSAANIRASSRGAFAAGSARAGAGYTTDIEATSEGAIALGAATYDGIIQAATQPGAFASGYAYGGTIVAHGFGARAHGFAQGGGWIDASQQGAVAMGSVENGGNVRASGEGSAAFGRVNDGGVIQSSGWGAFASGFAYGVGSQILAGNRGCQTSGYTTAGGQIAASSGGATAAGYANGAGAWISASGDGSFALGRAYNNAAAGALYSSVWATGSGAMAQGFANRVGTILASAGGAHAGGYTDSAHISAGTPAAINATALGALAHGTSKRVVTAGAKSVLQATNIGAWAGGYAFGATAAAPAYVEASSKGSFAHGYARDGYVKAGGRGAHAFGDAIYSYASVEASGNGALATGAASTGGYITASGSGAFAGGFASPAQGVFAGGTGSFAFGNSAAAKIRATASNAFQFGEGVNSTADTVQIGAAGLRFKQTTGVPGALQNGDIWVANNYVYIRSNGVSCKCVNANM